MSINHDMILDRQFIETVKSKIAKEFNVNSIELVGSYRRNEATKDSDVDFLILDDSRPKGMQFIRMICRLEEELGKEVGLVTVAGLSETEMKKRVLDSMRKDIELYDWDRENWRRFSLAAFDARIYWKDFANLQLDEIIKILMNRLSDMTWHSRNAVSFYLHQDSVTNLWQIDMTQTYSCDNCRSKINEKSKLQSYN